MGCQSIAHLGGERQRGSNAQCPRPGREPGPLDPESSILTMRPPRLPHNNNNDNDNDNDNDNNNNNNNNNNSNI